MRSRYYIFTGIISLLFIFLILTLYSYPIFSTSMVSSSPINYNANVCVYKNGVLHGCSQNLLYSVGRNMTRTCLTSGGCGAITNVSLCNATAGCGAPVAGASETYNQLSSCGLAPAIGTVTDYGVTGNWTVSRTFTSTCDNVVTNVTRLLNASGSTFAGNSFTSVTLQTNDQLTINWTLGVS